MSDLHQIKAASLEEALRQIPAAAVIVEALSGKLILINERAWQLLEQNAGWSGLLEPGGVGDFGDLRMFHPDGRPAEMEEWPLVRSMRSGEEVRDEEHSYLLADGSRLTIRSDASPIHDDEGRIVAGVLIVRDVTERKQAAEEQERLAKIVQNSSDFIGICDLDWQVSYVNEAGQRLVGLGGLEEARRTRVPDYFAPEDRAFVADEMFAAVMEEGRWTGELNLRHFETGEQIPVSWDVFRIDDPTTGDPFSITTIARDISSRKRDEEALRGSKRRTENIPESITEDFITVDREWRLTYASERALGTMRKTKGEELTREEFLGNNIWELYPELVGSTLYQKYHEALREHKAVQFEAYFSTSDTWYEVHAYPSEEGLSIYSQDITERKRAEEQLAYHASLLENIHDAVLATDERYVVTAWNKGAEEMYGWRSEEALGRDVREVARSEVTEEQWAENARELDEAGRFRTELIAYRRDGTPVHIELIVVALRGEQGEVTGYLGIHRDVTERKLSEAELRQGEERFRATFEQAAVGMSHTAPDGTLLRVNRKLCEILGYSQEEMLGMKIQSRTHPDDLDKDVEQAGRLIAGEIETYSMEKRLLCKDDSTLWINLTVSLVRDASGEPDYLIAVCEDIDERKRDQEELAEASRRAENILESVTDAFYALDREWRLTYLNERAVRFASQLAGEEFTLERLLGQTLWETLPAIVGTSIEDEYRRAVREQRTAVFEYPYPGGGPIFEVHAYPSEQGLSIYFRDITERKRAEQAIRAHARQQEAVAELGLRALASHDLQSLMDETVARVARTLELEYCKIVDPLHGSESGSGAGDEELFFLWAGVGWREGLVGSTENADLDPQSVYTLRSGEPVIVEDLSMEARFAPAPILIEHGVVSTMSVVIPGRERPFGVLGAYTESHRIFSEDDVNFLQAVANVLAAAVERDEAGEKLHRVREAERSRIARDLHDEALRDLTYALTEAQHVQSTLNELTPVHRLGRLIVALKRTGLRLRAAIYDLRLGREQGQPFSELLESLVELHRTMTPRCDIRLDVGDGVLSSPLGQSGTELLRVVGEALTNARRHSEARNVWVSVWASEEKLWAEVSDDGRGFDPDEETSASRKATGGTGIKGMRERARAQDGDLEIESQPGGGTKVRFELTMKKARAELETQEPEEGEPEEEPRQKVRILLVEDHAAVREAIASSFEREAGFEVVGQAASLAQARRMIGAEPGEEPENLSEPVDVALIDLGLPDGYGGELIGELRESNPEAQALVLSANLDRAELARAVESGAAGVLHKTVHLDEVVDAVRRLRAGETLMPVEEVVELLRFAGSRREEEYEARRTIARLTPREIEVLQALTDGLNSEGVAGRLNISLRTERNHVSSILAKLGVHSQLQALVFALRHGAVELR